MSVDDEQRTEDPRMRSVPQMADRVAPAASPASGSAPPARGAPVPRSARSMVPGLGRLSRGLVVALVALVIASALRLLDGWAAGRWWMLDIGVLVVGLLFGLRGVLAGMGAAAEGIRRWSTTQGGARAIGGLLVLLVVVAAVGARLVDDWEDLDVPAAWDRVDLPFSERAIPDIPSSSQVDRFVAAGGLCYSGSEIDGDDQVDCGRPHLVEVVGSADLRGPEGFPDRDELSAQARAGCADVRTPPLESGLARGTDIPDRDEWVGGRRSAFCVVRSAGDPTEGSVAG